MDADTVIEGSHEEEGKVRHIHLPENVPWYRAITVEPALFLMTFAITLCSPVLQNLVVVKTCLVTLGYNETVCNNLSNLKPVEDEIQPYSAQLFMFKSLIEAVIPAGQNFIIFVQNLLRNLKVIPATIPTGIQLDLSSDGNLIRILSDFVRLDPIRNG